MTTPPSFTHRQSAHCESGVVSSLLHHAGITLSEPQVFGLASGLTFAYIPFVKVSGLPMLAYRMFPSAIIGGIERQLGIPFVRKRYKDPVKAMDDLDANIESGRPVGLQTSVYWLPYFPPEMRFNFNSHNLIVYGRNGTTYNVSDPNFHYPCTIERIDLINARFAKGLLAPKGFMYYPDVTQPPGWDYEKILRKALRFTSRMMLNAHLSYIGIKGIRLLARTVARGHKRDPRQMLLLLAQIIRMQEEIGTGGGGFRFIYAAFLQEAGVATGSPLLTETAREMTAAGDAWRTFAGGAARAVKQPNAPADYAGLADLLNTCADAETRIFRKLGKF